MHLCRDCIAAHAVLLLQLPADSLDPRTDWLAPQHPSFRKVLCHRTFNGKAVTVSGQKLFRSHDLTVTPLHSFRPLTVLSVPSQPPQGGAMTSGLPSYLVSAEVHRARDVRHNAKLCHRQSLCPLRTQLDIMLSAYSIPRMNEVEIVRPDESAAGRGFAPGPSPDLARRKTLHFVGPRPQSAGPRDRRWVC